MYNKDNSVNCSLYRCEMKDIASANIAQQPLYTIVAWRLKNDITRSTYTNVLLCLLFRISYKTRVVGYAFHTSRTQQSWCQSFNAGGDIIECSMSRQ